MKQRQLGPDGPQVSAIGLGGMYLSITGRPDEAQAIRAVHAALDAGVTFIDTADVYCLDDSDIGHNERLIARALAGRTYSPFGGASGAKSLGSMKGLAAEALRRGVSSHRLVLAWMLAKSPVVIPIPGVRREETARDSAAAADLDLSPDDVTAVQASFGI